MAKSKIPGALERRHLLEKELSAAQALRYAEAYLENGRCEDAIAFFVKAEATEQLEALRRRAIEAGDVFLFRGVADATGTAPREGEWREISKSSADAGKERYAVEALRQ